MEQVAQRLHESSCIHKAKNSIMLLDTIQDVHVVTDPSDDDNDIESELIGNHFATIFAENNCKIEYRKRQKNASMRTELHPLIIHWFERELFNQYLTCMVNQ